MPLTNYRSDMNTRDVFESITKMLLSHGAKRIIFDYDDNGLATGIAFIIPIPGGKLPIKLPVRTDKIEQIFKNQVVKYKPDQPYKTGWKNIHDWIKAQMALYETEMVKLEEIFLPYIIYPGGKTLFESMEQSGNLLPPGAEEGTVL